MAKRKATKKFYLSVEGETGQWYMEWLRNLINSTEGTTTKIAIDCKIEKNPVKRVKGLVITEGTEIYHLSDYESNETIHQEQFIETMDNMYKAMRLGKSITYQFGYSNFAFELWIILHKMDCYGSLAHRKNYLKYINKAFNEHFEDLNEYKHEKNFKRCLSQLTIEDVKSAVLRSKRIMDNNIANGYVLHNYKGFKYYNENPSNMVWEVVEKMLKESGLM